MTDYNVTVGKDLLPELLSGQDGLAKLIESVLNQVLEAQVSDSLGAERYERSEERQSYRNGYRTRQLYPSLIVPKPSVRQIDPNQSKNNIAVSFKNIPVFFS